MKRRRGREGNGKGGLGRAAQSFVVLCLVELSFGGNLNVPPLLESCKDSVLGYGCEL